LTLEQAIALALRDNRQVKNAMLEVNKSEDRLAAARTRRLPEFKSPLQFNGINRPASLQPAQQAPGNSPARQRGEG